MNKITLKNTWIILPAYNEAPYIADVLKQIKNLSSNIIVINDGSKDNTAEIATKSGVTVLSHPVNLGKGAAVFTGCTFAFEHQSAEAVILLDSDAQHDPKEIPLFINALQQYDVVLGVRKIDSHQMPLLRRVTSSAISLLVVVLYGKYIPDILSGYKAFNKAAFPQLAWNSTDYSLELELTVRLVQSKLNYTTVPIRTIYHSLERGMNILDMIRTLSQLISWRVGL